MYLGSISPQGLELLRRRTRVAVSPPETWVPNLGTGDEAQLGHGQQHLTGRRVGLGSGREEGPLWPVFTLESPGPWAGGLSHETPGEL